MDINEVIIAHLEALPSSLARSMDRWDYSYQQLADETGLSKSQIHKLLKVPGYQPSQRTIIIVLQWLQAWPPNAAPVGNPELRKQMP